MESGGHLKGLGLPQTSNPLIRGEYPSQSLWRSGFVVPLPLILLYPLVIWSHWDLEQIPRWDGLTASQSL